MMIIENKFEIKQIVYLKTDTDQLARMVTAIKILGSDLVYQLSCGKDYSDHYEFEISEEQNILIKE